MFKSGSRNEPARIAEEEQKEQKHRKYFKFSFLFGVEEKN